MSCAIQPAITTGIDTARAAAASCAKNRPSDVMNVTMYHGAVLARDEVRFRANRNSFHARMKQISAVAAIPGLKLDGTNPTLLYGYGGFDIAMTPTYGVTAATWLKMGGVYVVASIRGGGEYGSAWHEAGTKLKKQNVFDDFIAAGEWLVKNKVASPQTLAINGGSNGGLLVGAVTNQRPDLFAAAVPQVGVMDMLRYQHFTIGWAWATDYGTSSDSPEMFKALYAYSPLHNIKPGAKYPAVLVTTADHDDRVMPGHSFKYAATLQAAQAGDRPVLIRIDTNAGHGAGKPVSKRIEEWADMLGFIAHYTK